MNKNKYIETNKWFHKFKLSILHFKLCIFSTERPCSVRLTGRRDAATSFHTCTHTHTPNSHAHAFTFARTHTHRCTHTKYMDIKFAGLHILALTLSTRSQTRQPGERGICCVSIQRVSGPNVRNTMTLCVPSARLHRISSWETAGKKGASHGPHTQVSVWLCCFLFGLHLCW